MFFIFKFSFVSFFNNGFDFLQTPLEMYYVSVNPTTFLLFTTLLFSFSLYGLISNMENLLFSLVCMEILLLSVSLNFIYFSVFFHDNKGQIFALLILGIAASEAAVGLSMLLVASRLKNNIKTVSFNFLKG